MGCGDTCPYFSGIIYRDWKLDDPAGQDLNAVRPIRNHVERHIRVHDLQLCWLEDLRAVVKNDGVVHQPASGWGSPVMAARASATSWRLARM